MRVLTTMLLCAVALPLLSATRPQCSCIPQPSLRVSVQKTPVVLIGRVLVVDTVLAAVDSSQGEPYWAIPYHRVHMRVERRIKGRITADTVFVKTPSSSAACGYSFEPGRRYIVFASNHVPSGTEDAALLLETGLCSATRRYTKKEAAAAVRYARVHN